MQFKVSPDDYVYLFKRLADSSLAPIIFEDGQDYIQLNTDEYVKEYLHGVQMYEEITKDDNGCIHRERFFYYIYE